MARARRRMVFVEGLEDVLDLFQNLTEAAIEGIDSSAEEAADIVMKAAKQKVAVDTGKLKESIDKKAEKSKKNTKKVWRVYVKGKSKGGVRYGFAVEGGTSRQPAKPYMRPATDENMDKIKEAVSKGILRAIGRVI